LSKDPASSLPSFAYLACVALGTLSLVAAAQAGTEPFSFSGQAAKEERDAHAAAAARAATIERLTSVPCPARLKNQKIMLLIAERTETHWATAQDRYRPLFQVIDAKLHALGLKTLTPEQIKADVAQAELDAYFKNDPDAALAASRRAGAGYILRGSITNRTAVNSVVPVNEVAINVDLTLSSADGRTVSQADAHADAYSSPDTLETALALVRDQADLMVARLYNDYCRGGQASDPASPTNSLH
jgi:hypothetical protein